LWLNRNQKERLQNTGNIENSKAQVLIVDDEPDICFLLSELLKQKNLVPLVAYNLNDAERALEKSHPKYLFLDNWLPDGFGLDFIGFIKRNFPTTKIIMMTAHDSIADRKRAFSEGADFFISKPLTKQLISEALSSVA
jgi:two-component system, OmpR family, response regulator